MCGGFSKTYTLVSNKKRHKKLYSTADAIAVAIGIKVFSEKTIAFQNEHELYRFGKEVRDVLEKGETYDCGGRAKIYQGDKTVADCTDFMEWDDK